MAPSPPDFPPPNPQEHLVTFSPTDPKNPRNFPLWRKWSIIASITLIDLTVSFGASGYSPATENLISHFGVSAEVGTLGLSLYVLGLALGPMSLGPLSEYYGRTPLYILPYGTFLLFLIGTALVQNIAGFLILRFFSGMFASVTIANFGGTIADLWPRESVGPAMYIFLWAAVCGSPMGFFLMSFVAEHHGWRTVFWALVGICGGSWVIMVVVLVPFANETRHSVLLRRQAGELNRRNDGNRYVVPEEMRAKTVRQLFGVTLSRPFRFLSTELIVIFCALYNGFLYGLSFLFNGAFSLVYGEKGYGFDTRGVGLTFLGLVVGISLGPFISILQERHYQKEIRIDGAEQEEDGRPLKVKYKPEARVQQGKIAGVTLPISLFWFAWTSPPQYDIHWIVPVMATALFGWSFYTLILTTYLYAEESYLHFAASALAGIGLIRNLFGCVFPLFGKQMFTGLGYNWAGTILACVAVLLMPIPFILEKYGPQLRARSPYARQHMDDVD
ncbi:related to multidrug resistant protein [Ramularia collo-cygni]|uniref:Related to multidrug resistant protein n=1 Tax=Ramularia collo-cygni TaxID=112498 RepID=A0A2D3VDP2_9PEZI|nr:related to multidrug resistant protein [Ramularia collo-cygni]CZT20924.1 related to multidrug resistant protein [Ramularia collo-cygni]